MCPEISRELMEHLSTIRAPDTAKDVQDRIPEDSTQQFSWEALMSGLERRLASTGELTTKAYEWRLRCSKYQLLALLHSKSTTTRQM